MNPDTERSHNKTPTIFGTQTWYVMYPNQNIGTPNQNSAKVAKLLYHCDVPNQGWPDTPTQNI